MKMTDSVPDRTVAMPVETLTLLQSASNTLIITHHNPDGDALGSAAGLALTLLDQGRKADLLLLGAWSNHLTFLLDGLNTRHDLNEPADYDLVILLDCHGFDRLGPGFEKIAQNLAGRPFLVVDHHPLNQDESSAPFWLLRPEASSTGELVWLLVRALGWLPPRNALQALLLAMSSDTGFFTQSNTTADTLRAAADILELGGDLAEINQRIRQDIPLRRLKLMGRSLESLMLHFQGRLATMIVDPEMLKATGALMADTEDFVEFGRSVGQVELSACIKDQGLGPGSIRVSLRSRDRVDARALALAFGGGGHRQAAAYNDAAAANAPAALENLLAKVESFL